MKQMIKRMTRVLPVVMLALIVGVSVPIAYAGTIDGGNGSYNNSGYGENNTAILDWTGGSYSTYANRYVTGLNIWNRYNTSHYYLSNSDFNEYTRAYACTNFSAWGNSLVGTYILSNGGSYSQSSSLAQQDGTNTGRSWGTRGNWVVQGKSMLTGYSSDLLDSSLINDDTIIETSSGILWSTKYNNYLSAVWVDYDKDFQTNAEYEYVEKIVYVTSSDGTVEYDIGEMSPSWGRLGAFDQPRNLGYAGLGE